MPNTPAYYPRTKKPRKKTKDERFIKRSGELREQNKRIRGAKTVTDLLKDKERGVTSPTQKKSTFVPDAEGRLPASRFAEAQITPALTPSRIRREKQLDSLRKARIADPSGDFVLKNGVVESRRAKGADGLTEAQRSRIRVSEPELDSFREEKRGGLHDYSDDM